MKNLPANLATYKPAMPTTTVLIFNMVHKINQKSFSITWPNYKPCIYVSDDRTQIPNTQKISIKDFKLRKPKSLAKHTMVMDSESAALIKQTPKLFKKLYFKPVTMTAHKEVVDKVMNTTKVNITCKHTFSIVLTKQVVTLEIVSQLIELVKTALEDLKIEPKFKSIMIKGTRTPVTTL